jgi:hypothetical protein
VFPTLFRQLKDESVFVKTWAIASLVILCQRKKDLQEEVRMRLEVLTGDQSISVRPRAKKAVAVLVAGGPIPQSWYKGSR